MFKKLLLFSFLIKDSAKKFTNQLQQGILSVHTCNPLKTSVHGNKSRNILLLITFVSYRPFCKISSEVIDLTRYNYKTALIFHLLPPPPPHQTYIHVYNSPRMYRHRCTQTHTLIELFLLPKYTYSGKKKRMGGGGGGRGDQQPHQQNHTCTNE